MNKFTVKDLIDYNNPCIQCGTHSTFQLLSIQKGDKVVIGPKNNNIKTIDPSVINGRVSFTLQTRYANTLSLIIHPMSNGYEAKILIDPTRTNKLEPLINLFPGYVSANDLILRISCEQCESYTYTKPLKFEEGYIKPIELDKELLWILEGQTEYVLYSHFEAEQTIMTFCKAGWQHGSLGPLSTTHEMTLPIVSRLNFKSREQMIKKLKTYMIFS